jgi:hypothetical protein
MANGRTRSEIEITLAPQVDQTLAAFSREISTRYNKASVDKILQFAVMRGASTLAPLIRADMPTQKTHKYGFHRMEKAIKARPSKFYKPGAVVGISLGRRRADKKGAWYAWIYTSGAKRHTEYGRKRGPLHFGPKVLVKVDHPGFTGRPFVEKSAEQHLPSAIKTITKVVDKFLVNDAFQQRVFKSINRWR